jgi:hypothetical protein
VSIESFFARFGQNLHNLLKQLELFGLTRPSLQDLRGGREEGNKYPFLLDLLPLTRPSLQDSTSGALRPVSFAAIDSDHSIFYDSLCIGASNHGFSPASSSAHSSGWLYNPDPWPSCFFASGSFWLVGRVSENKSFVLQCAGWGGIAACNGHIDS